MVVAVTVATPSVGLGGYAKPILRLAFADKLAVMFEHHARRVSHFKADLDHVFHHGEPVADE